MRFKVDPDTGAHWQVLDQVKYAEKVREMIRVVLSLPLLIKGMVGIVKYVKVTG